MQIQQYVRLLSTWCDWNCQSRQFLLGSALLNMGEPGENKNIKQYALIIRFGIEITCLVIAS